MKKTFSGLLIGMIGTSVIVNNANGQLSLTTISSSKTSAITALTAGSDDKTSGDKKTAAGKDNLKDNKANFEALRANFKATESFKKEFKDVSAAKWNAETDAISAFFVRDGIQTSVIYDKKGNWVHTIAYCDEKNMPKDIKHLVRIAYPLYDITGMREIKEGNITFYIIYLEDETSLRQVSLYNGELNVYKEFTKQQ